MPIIRDDVRRLATVEAITNIAPIPDADAIVQAHVRGWTVVVKKGEFREGQLVVYFEVDTALPLTDPRFEFLGARAEQDRRRRRLPRPAHGEAARRLLAGAGHAAR